MHYPVKLERLDTFGGSEDVEGIGGFSHKYCSVPSGLRQEPKQPKSATMPASPAPPDCSRLELLADDAGVNPWYLRECLRKGDRAATAGGGRVLHFPYRVAL